VESPIKGHTSILSTIKHGKFVVKIGYMLPADADEGIFLVQSLIQMVIEV
jgi:hypothetical protein